MGTTKRERAERVNLTEARVRALKPPTSGRVFVYDEGVSGLAVRITAAGSKTFYVHAWDPTRHRALQYRIGAHPALTVETARRLTREKLAAIAAGADILATRDAGRQEPTLGDLWSHWESIAKPRKRSWGEDERQYNAHLKPWANRRLSTIRQSDVRALHTRIGKESGPYAANRLLFLLSAMFNKAGDIGYQGDNPRKGIDKYEEVPRDRFLQGNELRAFFEALAAEPELWQVFFLVALLCGARRSNVQQMRWDAVDLDHGFWLIGASEAKAGKALSVSLSPQVVAILRIHREQVPTGLWVFPSRGKTGHVVEVKSAWKRICKRAGLDDCRPHDLRRSLGSWMAIGGASLPIVGKALGHTQARTTEIYARLSVDPVKAAVTTAGDAMLAAGGVAMDDTGVRLLQAPDAPAAD